MTVIAMTLLWNRALDDGHTPVTEVNGHHFKNIKKDNWSNLGAVSEMPTISIYFQGGLVWESGRFLSNVYNSMGVASTKNQGGIEICAAIHTKIIQFSGSLDPENQGGLASLQYSVHADMNWMGDHAPLSKFHICHLLGLLTVMASLWDTCTHCAAPHLVNPLKTIWFCYNMHFP